MSGIRGRADQDGDPSGLWAVLCSTFFHGWLHDCVMPGSLKHGVQGRGPS